MRQKEIVLKKVAELKNLINGQKALVSIARPQQELHAHLERIETKIQEIEVLVNRENESWN